MTGSGPLVVLSHGIGDRRQAYRLGWKSVTGTEAVTRTDIAGDLLALIEHLGGPAVIVGQSISGGAATIAAARRPDLVSGIVEINPFTLEQKFRVSDLVRNRRYRRGGLRLMGLQLFHRLGFWLGYLDVAYPTKPADYAEYMAALAAKLREPGRVAEFLKTGKSTPADAAQLPNITVPALVIMGSLDPDFPDPRAEGEAIVAAMPSGLGTVAMIEGAGHYPHAQSPDQVATLVIGFLKENVHA